MTQFSINVTNFWLRPSTVSITENLSRSLDVMILKLESDDTRYFVSSEWLNRTGFDLKKANAIETLVSLLYHDEDFLLYFPENHEFVLDNLQRIITRKLTVEDKSHYDTFAKECPEDDFDEAYVEMDHWLVYGLFIDDKLVSVASMMIWKNTLFADLGIVTLPQFRKQGLAKRLTHAICHQAFSMGYNPQFRCQTTNTSSYHLALSSGFKLLGKLSLGK